MEPITREVLKEVLQQELGALEDRLLDRMTQLNLDLEVRVDSRFLAFEERVEKRFSFFEDRFLKALAGYVDASGRRFARNERF